MAEELEAGLSTAIELAMREVAVGLPLQDGAQLALLTDADLEASDPRAAAELAVRASRAIGRGRPKDARNKRTGQWRDYLLSKYPHPLEFMASALARTPFELAAELSEAPIVADANGKKVEGRRVTAWEAYELQMRYAAELAPYYESKMATVMDVNTTQRVAIIMPGLNMPVGSTPAELEAAALDPDAIDFEVMPSAKPSGS